MKYYVYRFEVVSRNKVLNDTNVVSYRFINQGNTTADINGMPLVSLLAISSLGDPLPGNDIDLSRSTFPNEVDTTVYKIRFDPPPPFVPANNCVVVIYKIRATKRAVQMETMGGKAGRLFEKYTKPAPEGEKPPPPEEGGGGE